MRIIINADDAGIDWDRDLGIMLGIAMKKISSVSVLITDPKAYPRLKRMIHYSKIFSKRVSFGLHLNLTDEQLLTCKLSELCEDYDAQEHPKVVFWRNAIQGKVDLDKIKKEMELQYERFYEILGIWPSHIDGHNHCHITNPEIFSMVLKMAAQHCISCVRFPDEEFLDRQVIQLHNTYIQAGGRSQEAMPLSSIEKFSVADIVKMVDTMRQSPLSDILLYRYACSRLSSESGRKFLGTVYGHYRTIPELIEQINHIQEKGETTAVELMVHPGIYLPVHHNTWFSNLERQKELLNLFKLIRKLDRGKMIVVNQVGEAL